MRYKIYAKGNYLYIQNMDVGEIFTGFKKEVFVDKTNINKSIYRFFNVKDWDFKKSLKIGEIYKEDGSLYTEAEFDTFYLENTGNSGGQDLSGYLLKANNLSDLDSAPIARNNLGLGTLATQNGIFSGSSSGTNTGDETTLSIQTKRPLKTVDNQSLEGAGNIAIITKLTKVEILSSALTTQDKTGFLTYINSVTPFSIASNERVRYVVTDTGKIFDIEVNNRSVGSGQIALTSSQISEVGRNPQKTFHLNWNNIITFQANTNYSIMALSVGTWYAGFGSVQNGVTRSANFRSGAVCVPFKTILKKAVVRLTHANNATQDVEIIVQKFTQGQASPINVVDLVVINLTSAFINSTIGGSNASVPSSLITLNTSQQILADEVITIIARNKTGTASFLCAVDILMEFEEVI